MNTTMDLSDIKKCEFDILCFFKEYCRNNGIPFFLCNGTLLGAIKYKGFIPWDDDIDVFVPRKDYDCLVKNFKDTEKHTLFSAERNPRFLFPYAKLCDMSTRKEEKLTESNGVDCGVDIDIFPLDYWPGARKNDALKIAVRSYRNATACILSKLTDVSDKPLHKAVICRLFRKMGASYFISKLRLYCNPRASPYMGSVVWPIYGKKEVIPEEVFSASIEVMFEGESFPAPIGYHTYLTNLYGDYSKDPPPEERKTHHTFTAFRIVE